MDTVATFHPIKPLESSYLGLAFRAGGLFGWTVIFSPEDTLRFAPIIT